MLFESPPPSPELALFTSTTTVSPSLLLLLPPSLLLLFSTTPHSTHTPFPLPSSLPLLPLLLSLSMHPQFLSLVLLSSLVLAQHQPRDRPYHRRQGGLLGAITARQGTVSETSTTAVALPTSTTSSAADKTSVSRTLRFVSSSIRSWLEGEGRRGGYSNLRLEDGGYSGVKGIRCRRVRCIFRTFSMRAKEEEEVEARLRSRPSLFLLDSSEGTRKDDI